MLLEELELRPLLDLDMRLGEASGAAAGLLILRAALACHTGMATFAEAGVSDKPAGRERRTEGRRGRRLILIPLPLWERALKQAFASEAGEGGRRAACVHNFPSPDLHFASLQCSSPSPARGEGKMRTCVRHGNALYCER